MTQALLDTTVLIHYFRKQPAARQWVDNQPARLTITPMTWLELMRGAPGKAGQATCKLILARFDMEYFTQTDQAWAMAQQMEQFRLSHGVSIGDCLIVSVAHRLQVPLYTDNIKDMVVMLGSGLVIKPY